MNHLACMCAATLAVSIFGCSSGGATDRQLDPGSAPIAGGGAIPGSGAAAPPVVNPPNPVGVPGEAGSGAPGMDVTMNGCGTSVTAEPVDNPSVDIVWVVDASGSMLDEQIRIGSNIAQFADSITGASVDVRIVMLTTSAAIPVICPVTDPDPAAGTALAGDPRYTFIDSVVDSSNALNIAVSSYPMYESVLRPNAATHFIIVSDADAAYAGGDPAGRATQFVSDMRGLLGRDFFLHTISSEGPTACRDPNCMPDPSTGICAFVMLGCGASAPGSTYWELANMTGGLTASICQQDWSSIFEPLTQAIVESAPLPCSYPIPPPPAGQIFSPDKVNVAYAAPGVASEVIPATASADACADNVAWHFDESAATPSEVLLCPAACSAVSGGGTLDVSFGCDTVLVR